MERQYILPVSFAAALHAALLFGFSKPPRISPPPVTRPPVPEIRISSPKDVELEPAANEETKSDKKTIIEPPPPRGSEPKPVPVNPDEFITPTPPVLPGVDPGGIKINIDAIPGVRKDIDSIISREWLDQPPHTRFQPTPAYPFAAKQAGITGDVVVEFIVDAQGRVLDPRVVSSTNRIFEEPTLRAVSRWVFEPGRRDGKIVRFRMSAPVVFTLND